MYILYSEYLGESKFSLTTNHIRINQYFFAIIINFSKRCTSVCIRKTRHFFKNPFLCARFVAGFEIWGYVRVYERYLARKHGRSSRGSARSNIVGSREIRGHNNAVNWLSAGCKYFYPQSETGFRQIR